MPIFEVFSRRCGVSEIADAATAIANLLFKRQDSPWKALVYVQLKSWGQNIKVKVIGEYCVAFR
jgi:hypothetical protein